MLAHDIYHDIYFLYADYQSEVLAGLGETVHKIFKMFLLVSCQGSSICEKHVSDENLTDPGLCIQSGQAVQFTI